MTPPALILSSVPDLRHVPLARLASPEATAALVERMLPGRTVVTVAVAGFSSAL